MLHDRFVWLICVIVTIYLFSWLNVTFWLIISATLHLIYIGFPYLFANHLTWPLIIQHLLCLPPITYFDLLYPGI